MKLDTLDVVWDDTIRIQIDDVSDGGRTEFRASIYTSNDFELLADGWGSTQLEALNNGITNYLTKESN